MKILQVTPAFVPSKFGGIKTVSYNLSKALTKRGHEVTVYTTDADMGYSRLADVDSITNIDGFNIIYFRNLSNVLAWKHHLFLPMRIVFAISNNITKFDIIHLHDYRNMSNVIVYHYAKKHNIPYVLQAHGSVLPIFQKQLYKKIFDIVFGHKILKNAFKVIALTPIEAEQYRKMGVDEDKIEVVPNGIDLSEYDNLPKKGVFRRKYGLSMNQKMILFLARIHRIKSPDLLLKTFAKLDKDINNVKLVFVGPDDGCLQALQKLTKDLKIDDRVIFAGLLYKENKVEAYVDTDVYVLPSIYESFPNTVLEAMACGIPVIVTNRCGIADVIENRVGYVVQHDVDELRDAIVKVLSDEKMRERFGEEGKRLVREEFSWDVVVKKMEMLYERATN